MTLSTIPSDRLPDGLLSPAAYPHPVQAVRVVETHISWVFLTGEFAYKVKKPVTLGFLDFSTLDRRRRFCEEELRLNRRFSPDLYLDVVPITGTPDAPRIGGDGAAIEFAVRMRQFPDEALLSRKLRANAVTPAHMDALARTIAEFHAIAAVAAPDSSWGTSEAVWAPVAENFRQLELAGVDTAQVRHLRQWSAAEFQRLQSVFAARKRDGFVRECHGDLHANNLLLIDDQVRMFDCVEFNENFRWVDVLSDLAFACMDLADFGRSDFAHRLRNEYLEITGDYAGLAAWRYYYVYRALVRAKVAAIRGRQTAESRRQSEGECQSAIAPRPGPPPEQRREGAQSAARPHDDGDLGKYLALAEREAQFPTARLLITHGPSGSGKSTLTQPLVESLGAVRIRSDVERRRAAVAAPPDVRYSSAARQQVYNRMADLTAEALRAGMSVVVDATFLIRENRQQFRQVADSLSVPFAILDFQTPIDVLCRRVAQRQHDASEADVAVVTAQSSAAEPLDDLERRCAIAIDTTQADAQSALLHQLAGASAARP